MRSRGSIRPHHGAYQVRVTAGTDPVTGDRVVLVDTAATMRDAEKVRTKLLAEADSLRASRTKASLGYLLDRWLPQHEIEKSTRATYESLIRNHIRPALATLPLSRLSQHSAEILESFYADLRRCRARCDGRPFVEHYGTAAHDCGETGCRPHICQPLAASSVRQIHAVLSGAFSAAVRWGWMPFNPAETVRQPAKRRPQPQPPTPAEAARIIEAATAQSAEWGLYLWLAIVTGARRGELCALRWQHVEFGTGMISIRRNYVGGSEKDTKSHQMRRVSVDEATLALLRAHRNECEKTLSQLDGAVGESDFVFSATPDRSRPRDPSSMTRRYKRAATTLGIDTHLHALRHYSATELLAAGVDLRTVAGRLGHGDGTTTLRHYAAWVNTADQRAASILSSRLAGPRKSSGDDTTTIDRAEPPPTP